MDFIIDLPCFKSYDSILVVCDLLTKMIFFIPITKRMTIEGIIKLFLNNIYYKYRGLQLNIVGLIHIHIWKGPNQSFFDHHFQIDEQAKRKRYWNNL